MISIPLLLPSIWIGLFPPHGGISTRSHIRGVLSDFSLGLSQIGLTITFMSYQVWLMADAILRTIVRLSLTRRNMLEWVTAAQAKYAIDINFPGIFRRMAGGVVLALAAFAAVIFGRPESIPVALPFMMGWVI